MLVWTPHFARCVPTRWRNSLFILFNENLNFLEKDLSHHLFLFYFFLREKPNKKKKTLSVTLEGKKRVCKKPSLGPGVRLLIEKVR